MEFNFKISVLAASIFEVLNRVAQGQDITVDPALFEKDDE